MIASWILPLAEILIDAIFQVPFWKKPNRAQVANCKIVGHRGETRLGRHRENTLRAFHECLENQVWGIEFDIRWTQDHVPVVLHDPDAGRVFKRPDVVIGHMTCQEVRRQVPEIPSLTEVIDLMSPKCHLMIELKEPANTSERKAHLTEALSHLRPGSDFHFLGLRPNVFAGLEIYPPATFVLVSEVNTRRCFAEVCERGWGGLAGHYVLLNSRLISALKDRGAQVGVGFVGSRASLYRALGRSVNWIFSNNPVYLQNLIQNDQSS